jgi:hypothetical protein
MHEIAKKLTVISVLLLFLVSGLASASLVSVQESSPDDSVATNTVTLYRYGPDGTITPVQVDIDLDEQQDVAGAIVEKCGKLTENDMEIQNFINKNSSAGIFSHIISKGRGFHFKTRICISFPKRFDLFPLLPPYFGLRIKIPIVYCRYPNDADASTTITPLLRKNITRSIEGNHTILVFGFIGYAGWIGHFSRSPFDIIPRQINGYAMMVNCRSLP